MMTRAAQVAVVAKDLQIRWKAVLYDPDQEGHRGFRVPFPTLHLAVAVDVIDGQKAPFTFSATSASIAVGCVHCVLQGLQLRESLCAASALVVLDLLRATRWVPIGVPFLDTLVVALSALMPSPASFAIHKWELAPRRGRAAFRASECLRQRHQDCLQIALSSTW